MPGGSKQPVRRVVGKGKGSKAFKSSSGRKRGGRAAGSYSTDPKAESGAAKAGGDAGAAGMKALKSSLGAYQGDTFGQRGDYSDSIFYRSRLMGKAGEYQFEVKAAEVEARKGPNAAESAGAGRKMSIVRRGSLKLDMASSAMCVNMLQSALASVHNSRRSSLRGKELLALANSTPLDPEALMARLPPLEREQLSHLLEVRRNAAESLFNITCTAEGGGSAAVAAEAVGEGAAERGGGGGAEATATSEAVDAGGAPEADAANDAPSASEASEQPHGGQRGPLESIVEEGGLEALSELAVCDDTSTLLFSAATAANLTRAKHLVLPALRNPALVEALVAMAESPRANAEVRRLVGVAMCRLSACTSAEAEDALVLPASGVGITAALARLLQLAEHGPAQETIIKTLVNTIHIGSSDTPDALRAALLSLKAMCQSGEWDSCAFAALVLRNMSCVTSCSEKLVEFGALGIVRSVLSQPLFDAPDDWHMALAKKSRGQKPAATVSADGDAQGEDDSNRSKTFTEAEGDSLATSMVPLKRNSLTSGAADLSAMLQASRGLGGSDSPTSNRRRSSRFKLLKGFNEVRRRSDAHLARSRVSEVERLRVLDMAVTTLANLVCVRSVRETLVRDDLVRVILHMVGYMICYVHPRLRKLQEARGEALPSDESTATMEQLLTMMAATLSSLTCDGTTNELRKKLREEATPALVCLSAMSTTAIKTHVSTSFAALAITPGGCELLAQNGAFDAMVKFVDDSDLGVKRAASLMLCNVLASDSCFDAAVACGTVRCLVRLSKFVAQESKPPKPKKLTAEEIAEKEEMEAAEFAATAAEEAKKAAAAAAAEKAKTEAPASGGGRRGRKAAAPAAEVIVDEKEEKEKEVEEEKEPELAPDDHVGWIARYCALALYNVTSFARARQQVVREGLLSGLVNSIGTRFTSSKSLERAIGAVKNLALGQDNREEIAAGGAVHAVTEVFKRLEREWADAAADGPDAKLPLLRLSPVAKLDIVGLLCCLSQEEALRGVMVDAGAADVLVTLSMQSAKELGVDRMSMEALAMKPEIERDIKHVCAVGLCNLSKSVPLLNTSTVMALVKLSQPLDESRDRIDWCALALSRISEHDASRRLMSVDKYTVPGLIGLLRSSSSSAQLSAAAALCNLSCHMAGREQMCEKSVYDNLIVITLLRVNEEEVKEICAKALFNLLTDPRTRLKLMSNGFAYAFIRLARLESVDIQKLCVLTLYNFSCDEAGRGEIKEPRHGAVQVLVRKAKEVCSLEVSRLCAGALANLAQPRRPPEEGEPEWEGEDTTSAAQDLIVNEGFVEAARCLLLKRDVGTVQRVASTLVQLSWNEKCVPKLSESGATNVLCELLNSCVPYCRDMCATALCNLSCLDGKVGASVRHLMVEAGVVKALNQAIAAAVAGTQRADAEREAKRIRDEGVGDVVEAAAPKGGALRGLDAFGVDGGSPISAAAMLKPPTTSGAMAMPDPGMSFATTVECVRVLYNVCNESSGAASEAIRGGAIRGALQQLQHRLAGGSDPQGMGGQDTDDDPKRTVDSLSSFSRLVELLSARPTDAYDLVERDGIVRAVVSLARAHAKADDEAAAVAGKPSRGGKKQQQWSWREALGRTMVNLSLCRDALGSMTAHGVLDALQLVLGNVLAAAAEGVGEKGWGRKTRARAGLGLGGGPEAVAVAELCCMVLRNLSSDSHSRHTLAEKAETTLPMLFALARSEQGDTRENCAVCLHNLATMEKKVREGMVLSGVVPVFVELEHHAKADAEDHMGANRRGSQTDLDAGPSIDPLEFADDEIVARSAFVRELCTKSLQVLVRFIKQHNAAAKNPRTRAPLPSGVVAALTALLMQEQDSTDSTDAAMAQHTLADEVSDLHLRLARLPLSMRRESMDMSAVPDAVMRMRSAREAGWPPHDWIGEMRPDWRELTIAGVNVVESVQLSFMGSSTEVEEPGSKLTAGKLEFALRTFDKMVIPDDIEMLEDEAARRGSGYVAAPSAPLELDLRPPWEVNVPLGASQAQERVTGGPTLDPLHQLELELRAEVGGGGLDDQLPSRARSIIDDLPDLDSLGDISELGKLGGGWDISQSMPTAYEAFALASEEVADGDAVRSATIQALAPEPPTQDTSTQVAVAGAEEWFPLPADRPNLAAGSGGAGGGALSMPRMPSRTSKKKKPATTPRNMDTSAFESSAQMSSTAPASRAARAAAAEAEELGRQKLLAMQVCDRSAARCPPPVVPIAPADVSPCCSHSSTFPRWITWTHNSSSWIRGRHATIRSSRTRSACCSR
jgi:hypothetical protein